MILLLLKRDSGIRIDDAHHGMVLTAARCRAVVENRIGVVDDDSPFGWIGEYGIHGHETRGEADVGRGRLVGYAGYHIFSSYNTMV